MKIPFSLYDFFGYLSSGLLLGGTVDYAILGGSLASEDLKPLQSLLLLLAAYITGHAIAHVASVLIEEGFVRGVLGPSEELLFGTHHSRWRRIFPGYFSPLPKITAGRALEKAKGLGFESPSRALFFHCHTTVIRHDHTKERLNSFLALYGFSRNVCAASFLASAVFLISGFRGPLSLQEGSLLALVALLTAALLLYRYLKFYRLYTLEVFRCYAEDS